MELRRIANIQSGYLSRKKVEPDKDGSHFLLQARDVDSNNLSCSPDTLVQFNPDLSKKDWVLQSSDILFMARGTKNYSVLIEDLPDSVLAAGCFFILRVKREDVLPEFLWWYLNLPAPSMEIQKNIIETNRLMRTEQELLTVLAMKRKVLASGVCLEAVKNFEGKREE